VECGLEFVIQLTEGDVGLLGELSMVEFCASGPSQVSGSHSPNVMSGVAAGWPVLGSMHTIEAGTVIASSVNELRHGA
jgi:hypothetical protein